MHICAYGYSYMGRPCLCVYKNGVKTLVYKCKYYLFACIIYTHRLVSKQPLFFASRIEIISTVDIVRLL